MEEPTSDPPSRPTELNGTATSPRGRWIFTLYPVMAVGYLIIAIIDRRPEMGVLAAIWALAALATRFNSAVEVTRQRIRLSGIGRWRRTIAWKSVAFVEKPARFDTVTALVLTDGRRIVLTGIPATQAADVAAIGGSPLQASVSTEGVHGRPSCTDHGRW